MTTHQKLFTINELFQQDRGRYQLKVHCVDEFTTIRGLASRTTTDSQAAWLLEQTRIVNGVVTELAYADNAQFTQVWDDRLLVFPVNGSGAAPGNTNYCLPASRILDSEGSEIDATNPLHTQGIISGLTTGGLMTEVNLVDTGWTALPAVSLANRNTMSLQNQSDNGNVILVNYVNGVGVTIGWRVYDGGYREIPITDGIVIYGRMESGNGKALIDEIA